MYDLFFLTIFLLLDDYENTALFPKPARRTSGFLLGSADTYWHPPGVQDSPTRAVVPLCAEDFSSNSSQSSISDQGPSRIQHQGLGCDRQNRKHFGELVRAGIHTDCTKTLEFFIDRPAEPTFSQERNNLHAMEVRLRICQLSRHVPNDALLKPQKILMDPSSL